MWLLYLCCLLPILVGAVFYFTNREVNLVEWAAGSAAAFLVAGIVHLVSFHSQTSDSEVWSGKLVRARHEPAWLEGYDEPVYSDVPYTDSQGKRRTRRERTGWRPTTRWHSNSWSCSSNIDTGYSTSQWQFDTWVKQWGNIKPTAGDRSTSEHNSHMISGDPHDYLTYCPETIVEPVHKTVGVTNRIIAAKSVFNFIKLTPEQRKMVFDYPVINDPFSSNRVMGQAKNTVSVKDWDCMNSRLGPTKKVNLILIGFESSDMFMAELQRSHWNGGKKNDLVLCYGPGWSKVFGWSDSDILKKDLETILLEGNVSNLTVPRIEQAVQAGYERTNWHKFDHLMVEPNTNTWWMFWIAIIVTQVTLYAYFHSNQFDKDDCPVQGASDYKRHGRFQSRSSSDD